MIFAHLKTIFSFRVYHQLARATKWQMLGFGLYLFLLSLLVFHFFTGAYIRENLPVFLKNFPQVTFEKGVLTSPQKPVFATIPQSDFKLVFDATLKTPPSASELIQQNTLVLVTGDTLYMPTAGGVQARELPQNFTFTTSPENLAKEKDTLAGALAFVAFFSALFFLPLLMAFGFCLAAAAGLFFKLLSRRAVPNRIIFKWAFFMLGPLCALWYARLWVNIPLFSLAQVILCLIYMQQIFNTLPEEK
ncbi:MAG: DUF1189 domain-containing protein [Elusimicrobia bacterium]|nr:DUF1189 domain-containing protein [Elusimicrobiota bacterium]MDD7501673.1 DUF1189 family protein [Elusimicrobiota bacterium]MDY5729782.1 DUF1189 family protein [Elusimicrobiaceae bacterium]